MSTSPSGDTRDAALLVDIAEACARIIEFTCALDRSVFEGNKLALSAVQYQITALGEAVKRLSPEEAGIQKFRGERSQACAIG
jgi:uncharacterized protein with HEPN domain